MLFDPFDHPRSLSCIDDILRRRDMLDDPHMFPLTNFVNNLRIRDEKLYVPDFDPLDGGIRADILFLLEKPGPMTSSMGGGSGFISRNNDDPSAEATFNFMREAKIPRKRTVTWNVIPGWNGTRKVTKEELRAGVESLKDLFPLLRNLQTVVLVGRRAQRAKSLIETSGLRVFESSHPSPIVRASRPNDWRAIPQQWAKVMET